MHRRAGIMGCQPIASTSSPAAPHACHLSGVFDRRGHSANAPQHVFRLTYMAVHHFSGRPTATAQSATSPSQQPSGMTSLTAAASKAHRITWKRLPPLRKALVPARQQELQRPLLKGVCRAGNDSDDGGWSSDEEAYRQRFYARSEPPPPPKPGNSLSERIARIRARFPNIRVSDRSEQGDNAGRFRWPGWAPPPPPPPPAPPSRPPPPGELAPFSPANAASAAEFDPAVRKAAIEADARRRGVPPDPWLSTSEPDPTDWGSTGWNQDWDTSAGLSERQLDVMADRANDEFRRRRDNETPRDKWITPLIDWRSVLGAFDPDQERSEDNMIGESLANKLESQIAVRYALQLVAIPLLTGFCISRLLADPILSWALQNQPTAFAMTDRQKVEGAKAVHVEETRVRMDMAIGRSPPLDEDEMLSHLREFALEVQAEERHHNEQVLITIVSDSISSLLLFGMLVQRTRGRTALFNTISRLFEGLSDIAKAVMIILIADTTLGYHSEEGWTGFIDTVLGHWGIEAEEGPVVIFVGIVPVVIDVFFKYWIFVGLNKTSPGAVVTIKQIDRH